MSSKYELEELLKKRKRSLSVCFEDPSLMKLAGSNNNKVSENPRVKSCLKRSDNTPFGKFQKCIAQKEALINIMSKQKRVQFSTELNDCMEFN